MEMLHIPVFVGIAILLDLITGLTQAAYNKVLSSEKMRMGVYHKLSYVFALMLGAFIEYASVHFELGFELPLIIPIAVYIILTEAISIFENICKINPELKKSPLFKLLAKKD